MREPNYKNAKLSDLSLMAYEGWRRHIRDAFNSITQVQKRAPLFIPRSILERSEYISNFPQHVMRAQSEDDSNDSDMFLTPASCLHVYGEHENTSLDAMLTVMIEGTCVRHEDGKWKPPYRLPAFTMFEYVGIGEAEQIDNLGSKLQKTVKELFANARMPVTCVPATDAFFLGSNEGARRLQKLKGLKKEFVTNVEKEMLSLASLNLHEDYFGKRFSINIRGEVAHSLCIAFGLERLAFQSIQNWGTDISHWPSSFCL